MKKIQFGLILIGMGLLTGCAHNAIMPSIQYNKVINFQVPKNAHLNWEVGKQYSGNIQTNYHQNNGLVGALVCAAVNSVERTNHPSHYTLSYGKAEQAIFMTSLRDVLEQNHVFKKVELIADSRQVPQKDVLVNVFFKTARVSSPENNYKITLSVEMIIETDKKAPFKRTYLVQSDAEGFNTSFGDQQIDASNRLLDKIMNGIEEWYKLNNIRSKK